LTTFLNLASGTDIKDLPWVNLDVTSWPMARRAPDVIWDARTDRIPFDDESVDEVYAGYLLLHLPPRYHADVLNDIWRVLKPGTFAVFGEVDMALLMPRWLADPENVNLSELIWGEMGSAHGEDLQEFDSHRWGYTESKLRNELLGHGFIDLERIQVHVSAVWYELTIKARKGSR
jgi:hypothetical protein